MNPRRLKYLLVFVLLTLLTSASFASDTYSHSDALNEFGLFMLVGLISIHTFPVFPSKKLYSIEKDLDKYWHTHNSFLRFEFGSEVKCSSAVSSFYLGGMFGSLVSRFFAPEWNIQVDTCLCSILFLIGEIFFIFSFNWSLLAIGRFFLGMSIGITEKVIHGSYNPNPLALNSNPTHTPNPKIYKLIAAEGILFGGFLQQYFLNSRILAWRVFNYVNVGLGIFIFLFALSRNCIAPSNQKNNNVEGKNNNPNKNNPNPNKNNPNPNKNNPNPNKNNPNPNSASPLRKPRPKSKPDKGFKRGIKIFKILVGLYIFQQFSFINEYFSCTEEMFDDLPNIYIFLGVANFAGTFLNVAIEALKGWKKEGSNCLVNLAESVDMKHIYVTSLAGCAISSLLLLLISFLKNIASIKSAAAFGFIFCFSFGFGPSPWMIVPRILLPSLQEDYDSFGSTLNWLCAFIITFTATGILPFFKKISLLFLSPFCLFLNLTMGHLLLKF